LCALNFENETLLKMHQELVHSKDEGPAVSFGESFVGSGAPEKNHKSHKSQTNRFSCHLCSKCFKMKGSLMLHYRVVHYGLNVPANLPLDTGPSSPHQDDKHFHCNVCPKSFRKVSSTSVHLFKAIEQGCSNGRVFRKEVFFLFIIDPGNSTKPIAAGQFTYWRTCPIIVVRNVGSVW
jgi:hypothetical protein